MEGLQIDGRFDVECQVGEGGMGVVYRALDHLNGQKVAIKVIQPDASVDQRRFEREARILSQLTHPGIVRYVAHGETRGRPYLAMEWLEGETLEKRLTRGPLGIGECLTLGARVAEALAEAHRKDVVHRDLKPANLFLVGGRVEHTKVLDFGVARWRWDSRSLTATGAAIGTAYYMSPEQATARPDLDGRSDVFALATVLHECLTNRPVFLAPSLVGVLAKVMFDPAPLLRELRPDAPQGLEQLLDRMLAKSPADRPESAAAVRAELLTLIAGRSDDPAEEPGSARTEAHSLRPARGSSTYGGEQRVLSVVLVKPSRPVIEGPGTGSTQVVRYAPPEQKIVDTGAPTADFSFLSDLRSAVAPHEGRVDALIDGSLLVTSSTSRTPKEQAIHAARCALALQRHLGDVPIVIGTGKAVVRTQAAVGEVIETCARMLEGPVPAGIWLDAGTASLLASRFEIEQSPSGSRLVAERTAESSVRLLLGKRVPCIGRDRDLDALAGYFRECVDESVSRAVLVTGPPGQGKTRLLQELLQRLAGSEPFLTLVGTGDVTRAGSPFGMLGPALRAAAGVELGSPLEMQREKIRAFVGRRLSGDIAARVSAFLGEIAGVAFDAGGLQALEAARQEPRVMADQMRIAWLDWLEAECAAGPVLLVLEDAHWADLASVGFVDAALRTAREKPFMVLGFARPEVYDRFPDLFRAHNLVSMQLATLSRKASERLVHAALGDRLSADERTRLAERADGNPFFLEELIRAVDAGSSAQSDLPVTVLGMVHARLDALGEDARDVVRAASVFGMEFSPEGVYAVLGGPASSASVDSCLHVLSDKEVIHDGRGGARKVYAFRHALVREAAYALLTEADREVCHRLAGQWLESVGERQAIVVADHYERGGSLERAANWYREAAAQALERSDMVGVISCAKRGTSCGAAGEVLGDLSALAADAHQWQREFDEAAASGLEAIRLLPEGSTRWLRAAGVLVTTFVMKGEPADAEAVALRMLEAWTKSPGAAAGAVGVAIAAQSLGSTDRIDAADRLVDLAARAVAPEHPDLAGWTNVARSERAASGGKLAEATRFVEEAVQNFRDAGDARGIALALLNLGSCLTDLGAFARAEAVLAEGVTICNRLGLRSLALVATASLGFGAFCLGKLDEAERLFRAALFEAGRTEERRAEAYLRSYLSRVLEGAGKHDEAEREARQALDALGEQPEYKPLALAALANTSFATGVSEEAVERSSAAVELLESMGLAIEETFVRLVNAEALHAAGRRDEAKAAVKVAEDHLRSRADAITDPMLRASFLECVPDNARALRLAREWGA
jgi:serine/threonine protein kinase/tetratricopeptide (TPR) repeat protein